jgi:transcription elongation factor Elf1
VSLFDLPELQGDDEHAWVERPLRTEGDILRLAQRLSPPDRVYPCQRCSHNVSVIATGDAQRPAVAVCDPCGLRPTDCTCERIPYART